MSLHDLKPPKVHVVLGGCNLVFTLRPFDLTAIAWADLVYEDQNGSGFDNLKKILSSSDNPGYGLALANTCYHLSSIGLLNSEINTVEEFAERINNSNDKNDVVVLNNKLSEVFKNSFPEKIDEPELTGGAIFEYFKSMEAEKQDIEINWAETYMRIYAVGGMSIDEFYKLTIKQIGIISEEIGYLKAYDFRDNAMIHGIPANKIKVPRRKEKTLIH